MGSNGSKDQKQDQAPPQLTPEEIRAKRLRYMEKPEEESEVVSSQPQNPNLSSNVQSELPSNDQKSIKPKSNTAVSAERKISEDNKSSIPSNKNPSSRKKSENESDVNKHKEQMPEKQSKPSSLENSNKEKNILLDESIQKPDKTTVSEIEQKAQSPPVKEPAIQNLSPQKSEEKPKLIEIVRVHPIEKDFDKDIYRLHTYFEDIFQVTFHSESLVRNRNLRLLKAKEVIPYFSSDNFEDVIQNIMENPDYFKAEEKMIFLHNTYTRLLTTPRMDTIDQNKIDDFIKTSMSYLISYLISPDIFSPDMPQENPKNYMQCVSPLYNLLYEKFQDFTQDNFVKNFLDNVSDEDLEPILLPVFKRILKDSTDSNIENSKKLQASLELLENLFLMDKRIIGTFLNSEFFIPKGNVTGFVLTKINIFAASLTITAFPEESKSAQAFFSDKSIFRNPEGALNNVRERIHGIIDHVIRIFEIIMKADQKYKRNILDWIYLCLSLNENRQKSYNVGVSISSDGWFYNFLLFLVKFCQKPLEDISKYPNWFEKINLGFVKEKQIFNNIQLLNGKSNIYTGNLVVEEKKEEAPPQLSKNASSVTGSKYTFFTEILYMANHALFLVSSTHKKYLQFIKKVHELSQVNQRSPEFISAYSRALAFDVHIKDPIMANNLYKLLTFNALLIIHSSQFKIKSIDGNAIPELFNESEGIKADPSMDEDETGILPSYWAENIEDYLFFIRQINPPVLLKNQVCFEILMDFVVKSIGDKDLIKNPHLKAKYMQLLSSFVPMKDEAPQNRERENYSFLFKENEYYKKHLIKNLITFFVEVEKTGSSHQFYEKFSYRHAICIIINYLLRTIFASGEKSYVSQCLEETAKNDYDLYLQFIMLYLNDIIYLLDECLDKLRNIKKFQDLVDTPEFASLTFQEKQEKRNSYESDKRLIQTFMLFMNEYYGMIACITESTKDFFISEEIKDKFVNNLNYSLQQLNGKNAIGLKVKNMKELKFEPTFLLQNIVKVFLNLEEKDEFIVAVVKDERSFDIDIFKRTLDILQKLFLFDAEETKAFEFLIFKLEKYAQEKLDQDKFLSEINDIPDEFTDPLMNEIMKDPVLLPNSNMIVDRLTIMKHLLSDSTDPFNRSKLSKEMIIPQPELKKRIEDFFDEKKKEWREKKGK